MDDIEFEAKKEKIKNAAKNVNDLIALQYFFEHILKISELLTIEGKTTSGPTFEASVMIPNCARGAIRIAMMECVNELEKKLVKEITEIKI